MPHSWLFHCCHRTSLQLCCRNGSVQSQGWSAIPGCTLRDAKLYAVPPGVSKTAQPQQWHIPRSCGIRPDDVDNLQMRHVCSPSPCKKPKSVLREEGVRSTTYRAIPTPLKYVSFARDFVNFLVPYDNLQNIQLLYTLPADYEDVDLVYYVYDPVTKGSMLSLAESLTHLLLIVQSLYWQYENSRNVRRGTN